jgi:hypothetical protein
MKATVAVPGQFYGTVSGNTVTGRWNQLSSSGRCADGPQNMTMSADCSTFTGTYYYCLTTSASGTVNGTR